MGQLATRDQNSRGRAARGTYLTRARTLLVVLAAVLVSLLAPAAATASAQSGRKPQPTPTPGRPRRVPSSVRDTPGQPATPDAPSTTDAQRTQTARPASGAQPQPSANAPEEIDEDEVYRVDSNLVPVSANVMDAAGRAVLDLKVEDFELRVDGQPKPISDISFSETPVRLALLFDNSSSIRPTRELEKQAAVRFLRTVLRPAVDQAALFSISTYPSLDHPLTSDVARLVRTIEGYGDVEGSTALFDTIASAAEYLRPMPGRKVIVIVSDGVETTSQLTDFGEVVRRVLASDCQVFVIQTGLSENANLRDLMAERRMQDLTASTGGAVYTPKVATELDPAFAHISADLAQQYVLSYYPTDDGRDGRFRTISLRVKTRPNMRVRARRGYYPRRRSDLSAVPQNFTGAQGPTAEVRAEAAAVRPMPDARQPAPREESAADARTVSPVAARGTLHGSKNLDPETNDAAEREPAANSKPAVRLGNFNPPPAGVETRAVDASGARAETRSDAANAPPETKPPSTAADARTNTPPARTDADTQTKSEPARAEPNDSAKSTTAPQPETTGPSQPAQSSQSSSNQAPSNQSPQPSTQPSSSQPDSLPQQARQSQPAPPAQQSQAQSGAPAPKVPVSGGVLNGRALSLPRPAYPETARRVRVAGTVSVEVVIDESGKVVAARAISGPALLRDAAVAAARQARFSPTLISGRPVQIRGFINYNFSL